MFFSNVFSFYIIHSLFTILIRYAWWKLTVTISKFSKFKLSINLCVYVKCQHIVELTVQLPTFPRKITPSEVVGMSLSSLRCSFFHSS